ncbi:MAG: von Willebrand factor type A domain-containing protein [Lachnospiraceae bacterium]|nr:von Willebrand factor type A domain-containing protein [Lachnospiraceae bacterium]
MKRNNMRKYAKSYISLFIAGLLMLTACGRVSEVSDEPDVTYTEEEIEDRIRHVGRRYDGIDDGYGLNLFGTGGYSITNSYNGGMVMYEAVAEDADGYAPATSQSSVSIPVTPEDSGIPWNTEGYNSINESGFINTSSNRFSTFGADVDTATYSNFRRTVYEAYDIYKHEDYAYGGLDPSALRIEEMINYFDYSYPAAEDGEKFSVSQTIVPCPWNEDTLLYRVGVRAEEIDISGGSNIVFLVYTSGSMFWNNGLPLAQKALKTLQKSLTENDRVSIVTYAGSASVVAEGLSGDQHKEIKEAIDSLEAGGSTNGAEGIITAYDLAQEYFIEGGNNRVILCTDGDFNVGVSSEAGLVELIEEKKETGVFLSCLGFGTGNYKDDKMEALADHGNGNYFYIDCTAEAEKALEGEIWSTLYTVAKDTKFQVEFNPETVAAYRIIGYENRQMAAEDFADDTKDGGEVGSGQTVTILYEIVPVGSDYDVPEVESRYDNDEDTSISSNDEYCVLNIRYKEPDGNTSELRTYPVTTSMFTEEMDYDTSWAAGVAQVGMIYRDSEFAGDSDYDDIIERLSEDPAVMTDDYKAQFIYIVGLLDEME